MHKSNGRGASPPLHAPDSLVDLRTGHDRETKGGVRRGRRGAGDAAGGVAVERHVRGRLDTRGESVEVARDFVWRGGPTTGREDPIANTVSNPRSRGALRE